MVAMSEPSLHEIHTSLERHEAACEEKWKQVFSRLQRIEVVLMTTTGAIIMLLLQLVFLGD